MTDYSAWLIEMQDGGRPVYFHICDGDDWTDDHNAALHLARKDDAEKIIAYYGWTRAKPSEHLWPEAVKSKSHP